jgi:hypothetical protein
MNIPEKEILFNRYYAGEMSKVELIVLVKTAAARKITARVVYCPVGASSSLS